eukprot:scaffold154277_cov27-Tisochrysis_lutea.AAC.3
MATAAYSHAGVTASAHMSGRSRGGCTCSGIGWPSGREELRGRHTKYANARALTLIVISYLHHCQDIENTSRW